MRSRKTFVFSAILVGTLVVLLWPLSFDHTCPEARGVKWLGRRQSPRSYIFGDEIRPPPVGTHFCIGIVSGVLLAVFVNPSGGFDSSLPLHRWACCYASALGVQATLWVIARPLLIAACPAREAFRLLSTTRDIIEIVSTAVSQFVLNYVTLLRIQVVAPGAASTRASRIHMAILLNAGIALLLHGVIVSGLSTKATRGLKLLNFGIIILLYITFQCHALVLFARTASDARAEVRRADASTADNGIATRALATVVLLTTSALTTILYLVMLFVGGRMKNISGVVTLDGWWALEVSISLDVPLNAALSLLCAGLVGPTGDRQAELEEVATLAFSQRERVILERLIITKNAAVGPAVALASLFEGIEPAVVFERAKVRFRCISWNVLSHRLDLIICGGTMDGQKASEELYNLSRPCELSECDVFLSHSWHDDAFTKWRALEAWCERFFTQHDRFPTFWLDKVCIDQTNIKADLECLPIFLAGCRDMLVLSGPTYTSRLWCCVELFVHDAMQNTNDAWRPPIVHILGASLCEREATMRSWQEFDARLCGCFDESDKVRILHILYAYPGGVSAFNKHMRMLTERIELVRDSQSPELQTYESSTSILSL